MSYCIESICFRIRFHSRRAWSTCRYQLSWWDFRPRRRGCVTFSSSGEIAFYP
jgi:hypothetical protein